MAAHVLDNPVWHALATGHAGLAITADGAARYPAAIVPFAGIEAPTPRAADQLTSLVEDAESVFVVGVAPAPPPGWQLEPKKPVLQMVCPARAPEIPGPAVKTMGEAEVADMVALTDLVFPVFFRPRTLEMGSYVGIYDGRRLAAMAGERMRIDGWQEMSAVCTHPDYTGRGYSQRLLGTLCNAAFDRGFTPFLHVYTDNARAIGVYRKMGFTDRAVLPFWALHQ